jgi:3-oxoacyl-[acyl-carrier protein] reductase
MEISFKGKKVLVAGGSRGIGRSTALAFAANGADVAICAPGPESLKAAEADLEPHGTKIATMACDLGVEAQVTRFVTDAAAALAGIDVLINNASGFGMKDDEDGWEASVGVDLLTTVRATRWRPVIGVSVAIPF